MGHYRWLICTLLLLGTTKNYMDRQILGVLKTTLQHDLGWSEIDYSNLVFAFQGAYALGLVLVGPLIDYLGTRLGYAVAMVFWSLASMGHAISSSFNSFFFARFALGLGEAPVFPASIKAVAEWFPKKERALATGVFNAGANTGAILTALFVPWITVHWGWRWAFVVTGGLGFIWLILWLLLYRKPELDSRVTPAELQYIRSDPAELPVRLKWRRLLQYRQTWSFLIAKFLTDPIWWFYLFWAPDFLQRKHGLSLTQIGLPLLVIYVISDLGSVSGGWLSFRLIQRGITINASRKLAMLVCAACAIPVMHASAATSLWGAVLLIGLAAAAHQGFSANLFTVASDVFPSSAIASVVGIGGMAGAIGGMLIAKFVGYVLQWSGSYRIPFLVAASAYPLALGMMQLITPRLSPVVTE
jgi:MFS transporter, ACS family, hexuronate transporter